MQPRAPDQTLLALAIPNAAGYAATALSRYLSASIRLVGAALNVRTVQVFALTGQSVNCTFTFARELTPVTGREPLL